jgi:hypothetical protein
MRCDTIRYVLSETISQEEVLLFFCVGDGWKHAGVGQNHSIHSVMRRKEQSSQRLARLAYVFEIRNGRIPRRPLSVSEHLQSRQNESSNPDSDRLGV